MTTDIHARDDSEDTIIKAGLQIPPPPELIAPGHVEIDHSEAPTIIVSRAGSRHVDASLAAYAAPAPMADPASAPVPEQVRKNYAILIGSHAPIPLDAPTYIGRRPSTPRITGLRMPRLVMVPSPLREVSSTHVEILQQADAVVVTDLGSTNGTIVTMAGFPPQSLRQGESLVVGAETVVDIGDGIRIVIVAFANESTTEGTQ